MAGGGQIVGGMGCGKGQGGGGKKGGGRGWGKGGGVRGWILYLNEVLNKTGIVRLIFVIGMHITRRNQPKSHFSGGFPQFLAGNPRGMTS